MPNRLFPSFLTFVVFGAFGCAGVALSQLVFHGVNPSAVFWPASVLVHAIPFLIFVAALGISRTGRLIGWQFIGTIFDIVAATILAASAIVGIVIVTLYGYETYVDFAPTLEFAIGTVVAGILAYRLQVPVVVLTSIIAIAAAYAAYVIRCRQRVVYGAIEVLFGVINIVAATQATLVGLFSEGSIVLTQIDARQLFIQFAAGLYIVVRGLTNIHDAVNSGELSPQIMLCRIWSDCKSLVQRISLLPNDASGLTIGVPSSRLASIASRQKNASAAESDPPSHLK